MGTTRDVIEGLLGDDETKEAEYKPLTNSLDSANINRVVVEPSDSIGSIESRGMRFPTSRERNEAWGAIQGKYDLLEEKLEAKIEPARTDKKRTMRYLGCGFLGASAVVISLLLIAKYYVIPSRKKSAEDDYPNCNFDQFCGQGLKTNFTGTNCTQDAVAEWCGPPIDFLFLVLIVMMFGVFLGGCLALAKCARNRCLDEEYIHIDAELNDELHASLESIQLTELPPTSIVEKIKTTKKSLLNMKSEKEIYEAGFFKMAKTAEIPRLFQTKEISLLVLQYLDIIPETEAKLTLEEKRRYERNFLKLIKSEDIHELENEKINTLVLQYLDIIPIEQKEVVAQTKLRIN